MPVSEQRLSVRAIKKMYAWKMLTAAPHSKIRPVSLCQEPERRISQETVRHRSRGQMNANMLLESASFFQGIFWQFDHKIILKSPTFINCFFLGRV